MPGSLTRDSSLAPSSMQRGRKQKQKLTSPATDTGSKKKDKNAKDGGGVVAAVTKHAAKFPYVLPDETT